jgi:transcriptional regulator with XRE-family HTH domain
MANPPSHKISQLGISVNMKPDEKAQYAIFLHLLKQKRLTSGLTQKEIAMRLGKPQSFISKYESGLRRIDVLEYMNICKAISIDPLIFMDEMKRMFNEAE